MSYVLQHPPKINFTNFTISLLLLLITLFSLESLSRYCSFLGIKAIPVYLILSFNSRRFNNDGSLLYFNQAHLITLPMVFPSFYTLSNDFFFHSDVFPSYHYYFLSPNSRQTQFFHFQFSSNLFSLNILNLHSTNSRLYAQIIV